MQKQRLAAHSADKGICSSKRTVGGARAQNTNIGKRVGFLLTDLRSQSDSRTVGKDYTPGYGSKSIKASSRVWYWPKMVSVKKNYHQQVLTSVLTLKEEQHELRR